jgi:hypothetical protein
LGGEEESPLDGVLYEVVGIRRVLGKTHGATREVGDEARQTDGKGLSVVCDDGSARDCSEAGRFDVHRLPLGATEVPCCEDMDYAKKCAFSCGFTDASRVYRDSLSPRLE